MAKKHSKAQHEEAGRAKAEALEAKRRKLREGRAERRKTKGKDPEIGKPGPEKG